MISTVVIGANFGDEGKGLITDFEVRRTEAQFVARFNGGAQAGHTVHHEGKRHVFGHVGAGAFADAHTYLSSKFIVNPFVLRKELQALDELNVRVDVAAHDTARVSTLYDMALNAMAEINRGGHRHGSCGLGINETVTRHTVYPITVHDLCYLSGFEIESMLAEIHTKYVPVRMAELGITRIPPEYEALIRGGDYASQARTLRYADNMLYAAPRKPKGVVFEGAQGLALDEFLGEFPHVTRSMTGLPYAIIAAAELGVTDLRATYCTRSYLTRHGAGHLPHEGEEFGAYSVQDKTNVDNQWQGHLRFAPLNLPQLQSFIHRDTVRAEYIAQAHGITLHQPTLAVTCLDQLHGDVTVIDLDGQRKTIRTSYLPKFLSTRLNLFVSHVSHGPGASDIEFFSPT